MTSEGLVTLTLPITWHMAQALMFGVAFLFAIILVYVAMPSTERRAKIWQFESLDFLKALAIILSPIWVWLIAHIVWSLWALAKDFDPVGQDAEIRWHALAFVGLITAMGALVSAPLALIRVWTTERQTRTAEQGHITDRISKAVEQLGAEKTVKRDGEEERTVPNIEVRIGGLLSLERIAQDSTAYDKGRDHVRVMEILCAYLRENAPESEARDFPLPEWEPLQYEATEEEREAHEDWRKTRFVRWDDPLKTANAKEWAHSLPKPRADIALALQIIGRRSPEQRRVEARWGPDATSDAEWVFDTDCPVLPDEQDNRPHGKEALDGYAMQLGAWNNCIHSYRGYRLDLRDTDLQRADLSGLILSGADLRGARMQGANLHKARMEGADLSGARMEGAHLLMARVQGTALNGAWMEGANLNTAWMQGAKLSGARLEGAELTGAHMQKANLISSRMEGAQLVWTQMEGAELNEARMERADLRWSRLEGADLFSARLEGADLEGAWMDENTSLRAASLRGAALRKVNYKTVPLSDDQIKSCFGDQTVTRPDGIARPDHWPDWELSFFRFRDELRKWRADPDSYSPLPKPKDP